MLYTHLLQCKQTAGVLQNLKNEALINAGCKLLYPWRVNNAWRRSAARLGLIDWLSASRSIYATLYLFRQNTLVRAPLNHRFGMPTALCEYGNITIAPRLAPPKLKPKKIMLPAGPTFPKRCGCYGSKTTILPHYFIYLIAWLLDYVTNVPIYSAIPLDTVDGLWQRASVSPIQNSFA